MEYWKKEPLLDEKGRLQTVRWASEDIFSYNKDSIRRTRDLREWDSYELFNDRFAFHLLYGHGGGVGCANVRLTDLETGEEFFTGTRKLFPGDEMDLDTTAGEQHVLKYEKDDLLLTVKLVESLRRLIVRSDIFRAKITVHDDCDALALAVPFGGRDEFCYSLFKCFPDLAGEIRVNNLDFMLDEDTFLYMESRRGVFPGKYSRFRAVGSQMIGENVLGINLGWDNASKAGEENENALFWDGELQKLGALREEFDPAHPEKPFRLRDTGGILHLTFTPEHVLPGQTAYPTRNTRKCLRLYGRASGTVEHGERGTVEIRDMLFAVDYADAP